MWEVNKPTSARKHRNSAGVRGSRSQNMAEAPKEKAWKRFPLFGLFRSKLVSTIDHDGNCACSMGPCHFSSFHTICWSIPTSEIQLSAVSAFWDFCCEDRTWNKGHQARADHHVQPFRCNSTGLTKPSHPVLNVTLLSPTPIVIDGLSFGSSENRYGPE
jgi:hypothetical protein